LNLQLRFLKQLFNIETYKQSLNRTKSGKNKFNILKIVISLKIFFLEQIDVYFKSLSVDITRSMYKTMNELQTHVDRNVQKSGYAEVCVSSLFAQFYFNV
jgi:hypothetical protein